MALATIARLRAAGMPISDDAVATGLAGVRWPARVEVIAERPAIVLDTAHNVPSAEALVRTLAEIFPKARTRRVVFAVSSDKQYAEMLRVLAGYFNHFHLTRYGHNPRCVPPENTRGRARGCRARELHSRFTPRAVRPGPGACPGGTGRSRLRDRQCVSGGRTTADADSSPRVIACCPIFRRRPGKSVRDRLNLCGGRLRVQHSTADLAPRNSSRRQWGVCPARTPPHSRPSRPKITHPVRNSRAQSKALVARSSSVERLEDRAVPATFYVVTNRQQLQRRRVPPVRG